LLVAVQVLEKILAVVSAVVVAVLVDTGLLPVRLVVELLLKIN
jgi:hypothetical protein